MELFKKLRQKARDAKSVFPTSEHVIEWAFNCGGIDYYQFSDVFSLPYERGLTAVAIYNELDMRCTRDYLLLHTSAIDAILSSNEIDIFKIKQLNEQMKQRLMLITDVDLLYKLASVVFFDKNENPAIYESDYSSKKIEHWKKHRGTSDFFSQKPLMDLIPFLQNAEVDLSSFSALNKELNEIHSEVIRLCNYKTK